jgi:Trk-type K+ transport system membrane component
VPVNDLSGFGQAVLLFLMIGGGLVFTTLPSIFVRRRYMQKHLERRRLYDLRHARDPQVAVDELELRAVTLLGRVVVGFMCIVVGLSAAMLWTYVSLSPSASAVLVAENVAAPWFALFTAVSAFNNGVRYRSEFVLILVLCCLLCVQLVRIVHYCQCF